LKAATNAYECLAHGYGCTEIYLDDDKVNQFIITYKSQTQCEEVKGVYAPLYTWHNVSLK
jgi:hypothetical protein